MTHSLTSSPPPNSHLNDGRPPRDPTKVKRRLSNAGSVGLRRRLTPRLTPQVDPAVDPPAGFAYEVEPPPQVLHMRLNRVPLNTPCPTEPTYTSYCWARYSTRSSMDQGGTIGVKGLRGDLAFEVRRCRLDPRA